MKTNNIWAILTLKLDLPSNFSCAYHVRFPLLHFELWGKQHPHICCKSTPPHPPGDIIFSLNSHRVRSLLGCVECRHRLNSFWLSKTFLSRGEAASAGATHTSVTLWFQPRAHKNICLMMKISKRCNVFQNLGPGLEIHISRVFKKVTFHCN